MTTQNDKLIELADYLRYERMCAEDELKHYSKLPVPDKCLCIASRSSTYGIILDKVVELIERDDYEI